MSDLAQLHLEYAAYLRYKMATELELSGKHLLHFRNNPSYRKFGPNEAREVVEMASAFRELEKARIPAEPTVQNKARWRYFLALVERFKGAPPDLMVELLDDPDWLGTETHYNWNPVSAAVKAEDAADVAPEALPNVAAATSATTTTNVTRPRANLKSRAKKSKFKH